MNTRVFLSGPIITIDYPFDGYISEERMIEVRGTTLNTNFISINDRSIFIDTEGNFSERILLNRGNNTILIYARDRFDRSVTKNLNLVYNTERLDLDEIYQFILEKSGIVIENEDEDGNMVRSAGENEGGNVEGGNMEGGEGENDPADPTGPAEENLAE